MNFIKINVNAATANYTYNGWYIPRVGEKINWPGELIVGTVESVEWVHTDEVTVSVRV